MEYLCQVDRYFPLFNNYPIMSKVWSHNWNYLKNIYGEQEHESWKAGAGGGGGDNSPCHETEPRRENILFLFRHGARGHSSVALMAVVTFLL